VGEVVSFFPAAFAIVVGIEAGYVDDLSDPGGETKYGISKRSYPNVDIPQLTLEEAQAIYRRDFWDKLNLDSMPWNLALIEFDAAVNQGQGFEHTLHGDDIEMMAERAMHYAETKNFAKYEHGWFRRLFTIFKAAQRTPT
jgi:lysozyme family protein